jgi:hydrogenase maturation protease
MSDERAFAELLVIGVGNPDRADDAVGPLVATRLRSEPALAGARVIVRTGDMLALIDDWDSAEAVVLIDAAAPNTRAGQIHRVDVALSAPPAELTLTPSSTSTHAFGVVEAIELARTLGRLPARFTLFAIEGGCFEAGGPMTPAVAAAAAAVTQSVLQEVLASQGDQLPDGVRAERTELLA